MQVIALSGVEIQDEKTLIQEKLDAKEEIVFLLQEGIHLYQYLVKLELANKYLYRLKIASEVTFHCNALLKGQTKQYRVHTLSEVISQIQPSEFLNFNLLLDTDNEQLVSTIHQQLIYLDLQIEVMLKSEELERKKVEFLSSYFDEIGHAVTKARHDIAKISTPAEQMNVKQEFIQILDTIQDSLVGTKNQPYSVVVMSTRKSGKSAIVNSFLKEEYAPSSNDLTTTNTCIFQGSEKEQISLSYGSKTLSFQQPAELKDFLSKEFKITAANQTADSLAEEMSVEYIVKPGELGDFRIIDTPSTHFEDSSYKDLASKWIHQSDVVLFVVEYGKHLTEVEEAFLQDIKTEFEKNGKFYSFIVVVNKTDRIYTSEENKSVVRFMDYIKYRLTELGYKGFVVMDTSALQYFSAIKAPEFAGCESLLSSDTHSMKDAMEDALNRYEGKSEMTVLGFIDDQITNLQQFNGIHNATLQTLKKKSGIPRLIQYTHHLATHKAKLEHYKSVVHHIDQKMATLEQKLVVRDLQQSQKNLQEQKQNLDHKVRDLLGYFEQQQMNLDSQLYFYGIKENIKNELKLCREEVIEQNSEIIEDRMREFKILFFELESTTLGEVHKGSLTDVNGILNDLNWLALEVTPAQIFQGYLTTIQQKLNDSLSDKELILQQINNEIQRKIEQFTEYMTEETTEVQLDIVLPRLDEAFTKPDFTLNLSIKSAVVEKADDIRKVIYLDDSNWLKKIKAWFGKGEYKIDQEKLDTLIFDLIVDTINKVDLLTRQKEEQLENHISNYINQLRLELSNQVDVLIHTYSVLFSKLQQSIAASQMVLERDVEQSRQQVIFYEQLKDQVNHFKAVWAKVRVEDKRL